MPAPGPAIEAWLDGPPYAAQRSRLIGAVGRSADRIARVSKQNTKTKSGGSPLISVNRRARHDYHIEDAFEAGLALEGWEVKALRAGRGSLQESYVIIKDGEAWLIGCNISPLPTASTHVQPDPIRTRKLLLHDHELSRLIGATEQRGYTLVPLNMHWKRGRAKLDIALAKGKKKFDKRAAQKEQDWQREKQRLLKHQR